MKLIDGMDVQNATSTVMLNVTKGDVSNSKRRKPDNCAAAMACRRQLKCTDARIHLGRVYLRFNGHWKRYGTSPALRGQVVAFDQGGRFQPGSYILYAMQPSKRKGKHQGSNKPAKYKKRTTIYHVLIGIRHNGHLSS